MLKRVVNLVTFSLCAALILLVSSCGGGGGGNGNGNGGVGPAPGDNPVIKSIAPSAVPATAVSQGQQITITGSRFGPVQGQGSVELRGEEVVTATVVSWSSTEILIQLPSNTPQGVLQVVVTRDDGTETSIGPNSRLQVGDVDLDAPVLISVDPNFGKVGDVVSIVGQNFGSDPSQGQVTFAGSTAQQRIAAPVFQDNGQPVWTNSEIRVRVPSGARSGSVRVQVGNQTSNPLFFQVQTGDQVGGPEIDSVSRVQLDQQGQPQFNEDGSPVLTGEANGFPPNSDLSGAPTEGSLVSIQGTGFGQQRGNSVVTFSGQFGRIVASNFFNNFRNNGWSNTQILVRVPTNAVTGPIQVKRGTLRSAPDDETIFRVIRRPQISGIQPFALQFGNEFLVFGRDFGPQKGALIFTSEGVNNRDTRVDGDAINSWSDSLIVVESLPVIDQALTEDSTRSEVGFLEVETEEGRRSRPRDFEIGAAAFPIELEVTPTSGVGDDPQGSGGTQFSVSVNVLNDNGPFEIELFKTQQTSTPITASGVSQDPNGPEHVFTGITYEVDERVEQIRPQVDVTNNLGEVSADSAGPITVVDFDVSLVSRVEVMIENEVGISQLPGGSIAQSSGKRASQSEVSGSLVIDQERTDVAPWNQQQSAQKAFGIGFNPPAGYASGLLGGASELDAFDPSTVTGSTDMKSLNRFGNIDNNQLRVAEVPPAVFTAPGQGNARLSGRLQYGYPILSYEYNECADLPCSSSDINDTNADEDLANLGMFTASDNGTEDNSYGGLRLPAVGNSTYERAPGSPVGTGDQVVYEYAVEEPGLVLNYNQDADLLDTNNQPWQSPNVIQSGGREIGNPIRQLVNTADFRGSGATVGRPMIHPGDRIRIYGQNLGTEDDGNTGRIVLHVGQDPDRQDNLSGIGAVVISENGDITLDTGQSASVSATIHQWGGEAEVGGQTLEYIELTLPRVAPDQPFLSPKFFEEETYLNGLLRVDQDSGGSAGFSQTVAQFVPRIVRAQLEDNGSFVDIQDPPQAVAYMSGTIQFSGFDILPPGFESGGLSAGTTGFSSNQQALANSANNTLAVGVDDGFGYFQWYEVNNSQILQPAAGTDSRRVQYTWDANNDRVPVLSPIFSNNPGLCSRLAASIDGEDGQQVARPGDGDDWIANDGLDENTSPTPEFRFALWSGHDPGFEDEGARIVPDTETSVNSGIISNPVALPISSRPGMATASCPAP